MALPNTLIEWLLLAFVIIDFAILGTIILHVVQGRSRRNGGNAMSEGTTVCVHVPFEETATKERRTKSNPSTKEKTKKQEQAKARVPKIKEGKVYYNVEEDKEQGISDELKVISETLRIPKPRELASYPEAKREVPSHELELLKKARSPDVQILSDVDTNPPPLPLEERPREVSEQKKKKPREGRGSVV